MESQDYAVTFIFYCVSQCLCTRFVNRTNQNDGYYYPIMRDVLFSLFFIFSPSPLPFSVSVACSSGMRLLCPRFLSFMLDSRWDVQRSCYNVADCRLALVLWWRRGIAMAPLRLNCVDWRAVTHLRSNILECRIRLRFLFGKCNSNKMRSLFTSFSRYVIRESIKQISFSMVYSHSKYYSIKYNILSYLKAKWNCICRIT